MTILFEEICNKSQSDCFTDIELRLILGGSQDSFYSKVKRAIASGEIVQVRRGLYCWGEKFRRAKISLFEVAQKVYGPSYISFESALSYHQLIPEAVRSITSACIKRSKEYKTEIATFSFEKIISKRFFSLVDMERSENSNFMMAQPWRAIADYIYARKKDWRGIHPLIHSLRIEEDFFEKTDLEILTELEEIYKNRRVSKFLNGVRKDLKL